MPEDDISAGGPLVGASDFFRRWGLLMLIGAAVFVISYVLWGRKNSPASSSGSFLPGQSTQDGANGQPVVEYVPTTGDTTTNINKTYNTYNSTQVSNPEEPTDPSQPPVQNPAPTPTPSQINQPPLPAPVSHPSPVPPPPPPAPPSPHTYTYTIKSGDTLSRIAGSVGQTWQSLYNLNKNTIDSTSAQHGNPIPGGPWNNIFPGERIQIPA